jgi:hypothetical protein
MKLVSLLFWVVAHLGSLFIILWVAYMVGDLWLSRLPFKSFLERAVMTAATGLGVCSLILLALGVTGLLSRPIVLGLTGTATLAGIWRFGKRSGLSTLANRLKSLRSASPWQIAGLSVLFTYWLLLSYSALYPPIQWDATAYHLIHARDFLASHQIRPNLGITWPVLPLLNQLLFSWALAIWDDLLAQLVEHAFLMLTALGLFSWGRRNNQPLVGLVAATIWLSHPLVLWLAASAYVDVCLATYAFLGIYSLRLFWDTDESVFLVLGLVLLGMEAGTKITGIVTLPFAGCFTLWMLWRRRLRLNQVILGTGIAACVTLPWYLLIGFFTGNPVWPLFARYGSGIWAHPIVIYGITLWGEQGVAKTLSNFLLAPALLIWKPNSFLPDNNLALTSVFGLFLICWVVMFMDRSVRWWTLWTSAILLSWFVSSQQVRLLLPALPSGGLAIAESLGWIAGKLRTPNLMLKMLYAGMIAFFVLSGARATFDQLNVKGRPPISQTERDAWLSSYSAGYLGVKFINQRATADDTVYLVNAGWLGYHLRPRTLAIEGPIQRPFWPSMRWPDRAWTGHLKSIGVDWVLVNHLDSPEWMNLRMKGGFTNPFEPDYVPVYADSRTWVFRLADSTLVAEEIKTAPGAIPCVVEGSPSPVEPQTSGSTSGAAAQSKLEGYLDTVSCDGIVGWVWDSTKPDEVVTVEIYSDDKFLAKISSSNYRGDLERAGKGDGRHGFSLPLPLCLQDRRPHTIKAIVAGRGLVLGNAPKQLLCEN